MAERVDDANDPRLDDFRQLKDAAARRRIEGDEFFVAEGPVAIERLVASGHRMRSAVLIDRAHERMRDLVAATDAPVYLVDRDVLRDLVGFDLHRGAIAAADRRRHPTLAELAANTDRLAVVEGLNDPENLGAIARSARALGIGGLVLDPTCIDPYTRRTVRVSMGEVLFLPSCRVEAGHWPEALTALHDAGFESWAMTPGTGSDDIWTLDPPPRLAVLLGAEGPGLSADALVAASRRVRLPIRSDVDSLNVAAAAAVAFAVIGRPT